MNLSSCLDYLPQTWWLHVGDKPKRNVLVCGYLDEFSLKLLSTISQSVFLFECELTITPKKNLFKVDRLELVNYQYDSIIINQYSTHEVLSNGDLLSIVSNLLCENGNICLYEHNESFHSFFKNPYYVLLNFFYDRRKKELGRSTNLRYIKHFETISYDRRPHESHINGLYYTNKNTFLYKEKLKYYLFNSPFSRLFTNTSIWVMCRARNCPNMLNNLEQFIQNQSEIHWDGSTPQIIKIYYKSGKIILSLTSRKGNRPEYIAVIALNSASILQRDNEKKIVSFLQKIPQISKYVCSYYFDSKFGNSKIYIMSELSGVTVDINNKNLRLMTEKAAEFISYISGFTLLNTKNKAINDLLQSYTTILKKRLPQYIGDIVLIEEYLKTNDFSSIPSVFMHGDMKLENFLLDKFNNISGLIDFELSDIDGFPLLDLFYLISYNQQTRKGCDFSHAFWSLSENKILPYEQNLIKKYCSQFMLSDIHKDFLLVVFFLHHYSQRSKINMHIKKEFIEIKSSFKCVKTIIELGARLL